MSYTFFDLKFNEDSRMGAMKQESKRLAARLKFQNGYEASVITGPGTYGGDEGLYEVAVLHEGRLVYDTEITPDRDVLGWQSRGDVTILLNRISSLPLRK